MKIQRRIIEMPDTFQPIGSVAQKILANIQSKRAAMLEREARSLEDAALLKRFAADQIRKAAR